MAKEKIDLPLIRRAPAFEQPALQLPLPSPLSHSESNERPNDEKTERGIWIVDI